MRWRKRKGAVTTTTDDLQAAKDATRASRTRAVQELARQKEAQRQEQRAVVQPLRRQLDEVNHLAAIFAHMLHPEGD